MLEDIDSTAFRNILGEADAYAGEEEEDDPRTNPAQMGRIMKEVEKGNSSKQRKEKSPSVSMEYRSRGQPFMDQ